MFISYMKVNHELLVELKEKCCPSFKQKSNVYILKCTWREYTYSQRL